MRTLVMALTAMTLAGRAQAASLLLYNPSEPQPYCLPLTADEPASFWVVLDREYDPYIIGARFRISGLPAGCMVVATPSPAAVEVLGDLFSSGGAQVFFSPATPEPQVKLFEVTVTCPASSMGDYITLQPDAPLPTSGLDCPQVIYGAPSPSRECAKYRAISNHPLQCAVAVEPISWGATKTLFR